VQEQHKRFRFCAQCGGSLAETLLETEDRPRLVCAVCQYIHYINPKIVAATVPVLDGRVALLRRGIEPRKGTWTYPAGFMEFGESVEEAAIRETKEETNLDVELAGLLGVYSRPEIGMVNIVFLARVTGGEPALSRECAEFRLVTPEEIPWGELAFNTTEWVLRDWVQRVTGED
jgi:ADP-ribose pyrophosphatase YjhB (NUDIX family)